MLNAGDCGADFLAGASRQGRAEDMARRVGAVGAGKNDRLAMVWVCGQGENFAGEAQLARRENRRGIAVVAAVDDQRARRTEMGFLQYTFVEIAVNYLVPLLQQATRVGFVFVDDHGGDLRLL